MRLARGLSLGAWLIVVINLLMAFGAIGIFTRMTPAIAEIISNNERSLQACEEMLTAIALTASNNGNAAEHKKYFKNALDRARNTISEAEEPAIIKVISHNFENIFTGDNHAVLLTTNAILELSKINRNAMISADKKAQQLGRGGAWGIVFMAIFSFLVGIVFIQQMTSKLLQPLEEIKTVLMEHQSGENRRRCTGINLPTDIRGIFGIINRLLDSTGHDFSNNQ